MGVSNLFSLDGKVALVTGASRGIGRGIAVGLASAGANLALVARSESKLIEAQQEIRSIGAQVEIFPCDLSQTDDIPALVGEVIGAFEQIDILVNNAGTTHRDDAVDFPEDRWDEIKVAEYNEEAFASLHEEFMALDMLHREQRVRADKVEANEIFIND